MHRFAHAAAVAATATALAACTPAGGADTTAVTVTSCGTTVAVPADARAVVALKSSAVETVVALGGAAQLIAVAALDGELPTHVTGVDDAAWDVTLPVLSEDVPSFEAVLELEPDAVLAGWESNLSAEGAGAREDWADLGVATWVSPSACREPAQQPDHLGFDDVFAEIEAVGVMLGREEEATAVVTAQRAALADLEDRVSGRTDRPRTLWWSSGTDTPFVGGGIGAPQLIMDTAGLANVAGDVADTWASLSWEEIAERDPEVIVLVDSAWNTAEHKSAALTANPVTAAMDAVREERYLVVPFPATQAGVRTLDAVITLADQLTGTAAVPGVAP
ncbi:MAG: ABC transporter substrate-binding protein [Actinomycetota bacterium]